MENNASKLVSSAILGYDFRRVFVNGKMYDIMPPTIHTLCGVGFWLSELGEGETVKELLQSFKNFEGLCKALSFFIAGNESLSEELSQGTITEVVDALEAGFSLLDTENFQRLSALTRSARSLIAKQR